MGTIDDVRKVIQDLVAPDLKAISARIDGLEKTMKAHLDGIESKIDALTKATEMRSSYIEKTMTTRLDTLAAQMTANHAAILSSLEIDKRVARLEEQARANDAQRVSSAA